MLRGHFKSTLVCTASDEYVMGKENEKCGDAENKQKIGCWRIKYGKLWDTVKSLILTWNRGTRLWCTLMVVRCLWGRCPLLGGSEDGTSLWHGRRQKWPEAASAVAKNVILTSEDPFCFDFFFSRLEIKWSRTELHKTFYRAHEILAQVAETGESAELSFTPASR